MFSADIKIQLNKFKILFCPWKQEKPLSKGAHNRAQKIFSVKPTGLNTAQISIYIPLKLLTTWLMYNDWTDIIVKSEKKRVMLNELFLPQQSFCWIGIRVWIRVKPQSAKAASGQLEHIGGKYFLKLQSYFFFIPV